jgi:hypothetical protein
MSSLLLQMSGLNNKLQTIKWAYKWKVKIISKNIDGAERRYFASEVRAVVVDGEAVRAVDGYAAKFNSPTTVECIILLSKRSGAFDDCLNDDVRCLLTTIQTIFWHDQKKEELLSSKWMQPD